MVAVWTAEVSLPPLVVPPSSVAVTVIVAVPLAFGAGVKVSVPVGSIVGWVENSAGWSAVVVNETVCAASSVGPGDDGVGPAGDGRLGRCLR